MLRHGAVNPGAKPGDDEPGAWGYAVARGLTESPGNDVYVWQDPDDGHWGVNTYGANLKNYYVIDQNTLAGAHHTEGSQTSLFLLRLSRTLSRNGSHQTLWPFT